MGDENPLIYLLGGGGLATILGVFLKGAWDYFKGRHDRERERAKDRRDTITELKSEVRQAEKDADYERAERLHQQHRAHQYWEYAQRLRQYILRTDRDNGVTAEDLPEWPKID